MFAKELLSIPDDEWSEWGGNFEKPDGEGTSKSVVDGGDCEFRLYFKGLVSQESVNGKTVEFSGIGVATSGPTDNVTFELKKPLIGDRMNKNAVEIKALIEGLNAALSLELKRVQIITDYFPLYQFITGRWPPKQRKIAVLVNQAYDGIIHGIQFSMLTQLGLRPKELNNIRAVGKDENVKLSYNGDIQYQLFENGEVAGKGNFWLAVN
ncbi:hypothetical protein Q3G72_017393 [Acer saccharum]|nr:hypothetical protein Q3G72_017393 [Acer saccharum]